MESYLRRTAYKGTTISTNESFYDDSDMKEEYFLVIVYDKDSNTPLLSCRYYYSKITIEECLRGEERAEPCIDLTKFGKIFLADRLSGNINHPLYRKHRNDIFLSFYSVFLKHCADSDFILMARKEKQDKLLKKYLDLGMGLKGSTKHKGTEHWILLGNVERCYKANNLSPQQKIILHARRAFK